MKAIQNQIEQKNQQKEALLQKLQAIEGEKASLEETLRILAATQIKTEVKTEDIKALPKPNFQPQEFKEAAQTAQQAVEKAESSKKQSWAELVEEEEERQEAERKAKKNKWYVIFNGSFRGLYNKWEIAAQHINGNNVVHKSFDTKEEAQKALEEDKTYAATVRRPPAKEKLTIIPKRGFNPAERIRQLKTVDQIRAAKTVSEEEFHQILTSVEKYQDVHTTMGFYLVSHFAGPKCIFVEGSEPLTLYRYAQAGVIDTVYTDTGNEFNEFPMSFISKIKEYITKFSKGRKVFVKFKSSYPVYEDGQIKVPTIHLVYYGVAGQSLPPVGTAEAFSEESVARSLSILYQALQKIEEEINYYEEAKIESVPGGFTKVLYRGAETLLYSKFPKPTSEGGKKAIVEFSKPLENLTGVLASLPRDIAIRYCLSLADKGTNHKCANCPPSKEYVEEISPESPSSVEIVYDETKDESHTSAYDD